MKTLKISLQKGRKLILFIFLAIVSTMIVRTAIASYPAGQIYVDNDLCNGCGLCEEYAPSCFVIFDGKAHVISGWENYLWEYTEAIKYCPTGAIKWY